MLFELCEGFYSNKLVYCVIRVGIVSILSIDLIYLSFMTRFKNLDNVLDHNFFIKYR